MLNISETVLVCHKFCQNMVFDYFHQGFTAKIYKKNIELKESGSSSIPPHHASLHKYKVLVEWKDNDQNSSLYEWVSHINTLKVAFGTRESTLLLTSRFLGMWFLTIWMPRNVAISMFDFIKNLLRFLRIWDDNAWFNSRNLKWIIYFSHSILRFECELSSPLKRVKVASSSLWWD